MIVSTARLRGTIGGGRLEYVAAEQARAVLALAPGTWRIQDYPLGPLLGQCCGGRVRLLVERLDPNSAEWLRILREGDVLVTNLSGDRPVRTMSDRHEPPALARGPWPSEVVEVIGEVRRPVYLFGAGHVGQAIARIVRTLPFTLAWFDARAEFGEIDEVTYVPPERLPGCAAQAPADAALLILTHDHGLDYAITAAALRGQARFVGLIGSATKRAGFTGRLAREGLDTGRLTCPIGVAGIDGKAPEVIAVAVTAQLLMDNKAAEPVARPGNHMRRAG
jgi:xanthine dehydrogenase accessory factor